MHGRKNNLIRPGGHPVPVERGDRPRPGFITAHPDGVLLAIKLQPRASKNEICDATGSELRVRVTASPVDAAANEALLRLLAATFDCPRGKVELIRGHASRHKTVKIYDISAAAAFTKLDSAGA